MIEKQNIEWKESWNQGELPDNWTVEKLTVKHPSIPFNPKISNALFRIGYIEAWGRGTINMMKECMSKHLPLPTFKYDYSGLIVEFQRFTKDYLIKKGLTECLTNIVLFVQEHGKISNSDVQNICSVTKRTASRYLSELNGKFLKKQGETGKGTFYSLMGSLIN